MKVTNGIELEKVILSNNLLHVIDVREPFEVAEGTIPGAINIPLGQLPQQVNTLNKEQHYYVVCRSGARSLNAVAFLNEHGYDATNVEGGMLMWNGPVE
ncbi:rhodanese-like domain-containing protein [Amphibacillus cookii]|uniref:rhodanese-like domain-containing protein n=1 Tax=Amphibacillus cookii TaxID=767787 RepID=UPI00195ED549|nr:rhodanese-like domain-containing protein [Amphibacillus cookii]MBM7540333.1 rhodanese-related sulfurtransferase [Amphibacillus cookii]